MSGRRHIRPLAHVERVAGAGARTPPARADKLLSREGRMVAALEGFGRGADCFEGELFCMETG